MLPSFANDQVTLTEPVWVDERGKKVKTYPGPGAVIEGCSVQPAGSSSDRAGRDNVTWELTALLPPDTPITRHAKVTYEGDDYKIQGKPHRRSSPTGAVSHIELRLVDWEG